MRDIDDILHFRRDISPFLVHLTRATEAMSARGVLHAIIAERQLRSGSDQLSDARFGMRTYDLTEQERSKYFAAACLTETPLSQVHCLLEIAYRTVNLEPYGLVYLKDRLSSRGVSPAIYINNEAGDKDVVARALCSLIASDPAAAAELLPLVAVYGTKLQAPQVAAAPEGTVDFRWEREWRYPYAKCPLEFSDADVFVGLCPHDEIDEFEAAFAPVKFIDPRRTMEWYATKLILSRQRLDLKDSVI